MTCMAFRLDRTRSTSSTPRYVAALTQSKPSVPARSGGPRRRSPSPRRSERKYDREPPRDSRAPRERSPEDRAPRDLDRDLDGGHEDEAARDTDARRGRDDPRDDPRDDDPRDDPRAENDAMTDARDAPADAKQDTREQDTEPAADA